MADGQSITTSHETFKLQLSTRDEKTVRTKTFKFPNFGATWHVKQCGKGTPILLNINIEAIELFNSCDFYFELSAINLDKENEKSELANFAVLIPWRPLTKADNVCKIKTECSKELYACYKISITFKKIASLLSPGNRLDRSVKEEPENQPKNNSFLNTTHTPDPKKRRLLNDTKYSDFTFIVQGKDIKAHKAVLAYESLILEVMIENDHVVVDNIDPDIFKDMLQFIYTSEIPHDIDDIAIDLYKAAKFCGIEELKKICASKFSNSLTVENSVDIYQYAVLENNLELKEKAWCEVKRALKIYFEMKEEPISDDDLKEVFQLYNEIKKKNDSMNKILDKYRLHPKK